MQMIRMIMISVLAGIFAAGLVWLSADLAFKLRARHNAEDDEPEDDDAGEE